MDSLLLVVLENSENDLKTIIFRLPFIIWLYAGSGLYHAISMIVYHESLICSLQENRKTFLNTTQISSTLSTTKTLMCSVRK